MWVPSQFAIRIVAIVIRISLWYMSCIYNWTGIIKISFFNWRNLWLIQPLIFIITRKINKGYFVRKLYFYPPVMNVTVWGVSLLSLMKNNAQSQVLNVSLHNINDERWSHSHQTCSPLFNTDPSCLPSSRWGWWRVRVLWRRRQGVVESCGSSNFTF